MYVRVKGFQIYADRHGKLRCYHRQTRTAVDLARFPIGSPEFFAECERIRQAGEVKDSRAGTLGALMKSYRAGPAFNELAATTREDYDRAMNYLSVIDDLPLLDFDTPFVVQVRDRALQRHKWRFANKVHTMLSILFSWGVERGYMKTNPVMGLRKIKRPKDMQAANVPWTDAERYTVLEAAKTEEPRLYEVIALMAATGISPVDVTKLLRDDYSNGRIVSTRSKTGVNIALELSKDLCRILDAMPVYEHGALFSNNKGKPWTEHALRSAFARFRNPMAEQGRVRKEITLKGLRHTVATILRESGKDDRFIADALSQKTTAMAQHYSRHADMSRKMREVSKAVEKEDKKRRKLYNQQKNSV